MTTIARLDGVTRRFGETVALDAVDLTIDQGELIGLLGPNGAGKSTLLSLLLGRRRASAGSVELFGGDPASAARRLGLGSTPQETALPETLRVSEVVALVAAHYPERRPTEELAEEFGFSDLLRRQCGALSGGQKRRIAVALAFVGRPRLVLLDEPTTGLDVDARHGLWAAIRRHHSEGTTVVVTSHYLEEIEALAERVVVIDQGRVLADGSLAAVRDRVDSAVVELATSAPDQVAALAGVARAEQFGDRWRLTVADADGFVRALVHANLPFSGLAVRGASLEEAFLSLTSLTDRSAA